MEQPTFNAKEKLSEARAQEIIKHFRDAGLAIDESAEFFIVHIQKNGEEIERHIPKWKSIDYVDPETNKSAGSVKIEKDIENTFREDENPETQKVLARLGKK